MIFVPVIDAANAANHMPKATLGRQRERLRGTLGSGLCGEGRGCASHPCRMLYRVLL